MSIVAVIPARGGSKGIPRKNLVRIAGRPLIAYAIEAARNAASVDRVLISTDDSEIADVARELGAEVPFLRPPELAADAAPMLGVLTHALAWLESQGEARPAISKRPSHCSGRPLPAVSSVWWKCRTGSTRFR
jgi:CMP-N-acetylneuraminic acid synthetase